MAASLMVVGKVEGAGMFLKYNRTTSVLVSFRLRPLSMEYRQSMPQVCAQLAVGIYSRWGYHR